ncbi:MAG: hypothetical protein AAGK97_13700 [Bacteroidota bacterium]
MAYTAFQIASFNYKGFKYRNYNYLRKLYTKVDILLLQEHWLFDFEFNVLPESQFITKSLMENDSILIRQTFWWGLEKYYSLNFEAIQTSSKRLVAAVIMGEDVAREMKIFNILCQIHTITLIS